MTPCGFTENCTKRVSTALLSLFKERPGGLLGAVLAVTVQEKLYSPVLGESPNGGSQMGA